MRFPKKDVVHVPVPQEMQEKTATHAKELENMKKGVNNEDQLEDELLHDGLFAHYQQFLATKNLFSRGMQQLEKMSLKKRRKT